MATPITRTDTHPLFPDSLKQLTLSLTSAEQIGVSLRTIPQVLNGFEHDIANEWLTIEEREQLDRYTFTKRRLEWLSGRICVKQAVIDLLKSHGVSSLPAGSDFSVVSGPSGRPFLNQEQLPNSSPHFDISISHSHDLAIALAGGGRCGIDLQYMSETLFKVKHRYCSDVEAVVLDQLPLEELTQLGLLWVAKEALRKSLSETRIVGFTELILSRATSDGDYFLLHFQPEIDGFSFPEPDLLSVICHYSNSFALAVCIHRDEGDHAGAA